MKRILSAILILLFCLALVSCANEKYVYYPQSADEISFDGTRFSPKETPVSFFYESGVDAVEIDDNDYSSISIGCEGKYAAVICYTAEDTDISALEKDIRGILGDGAGKTEKTVLGKTNCRRIPFESNSETAYVYFFTANSGSVYVFSLTTEACDNADLDHFSEILNSIRVND